MSDREPRQRVERVRGSRRARLTKVEGTLADSEAEATLKDGDADPVDPSGETGPNDARLRQDVPPHYS